MLPRHKLSDDDAKMHQILTYLGSLVHLDTSASQLINKEVKVKSGGLKNGKKISILNKMKKKATSFLQSATDSSYT